MEARTSACFGTPSQTAPGRGGREGPERENEGEGRSKATPDPKPPETLTPEHWREGKRGRKPKIGQAEAITVRDYPPKPPAHRPARRLRSIRGHHSPGPGEPPRTLWGTTPSPRGLHPSRVIPAPVCAPPAPLSGQQRRKTAATRPTLNEDDHPSETPRAPGHDGTPGTPLRRHNGRRSGTAQR